MSRRVPGGPVLAGAVAAAVIGLFVVVTRCAVDASGADRAGRAHLQRAVGTSSVGVREPSRPASGGYASAYGPGLYGNRLACGGRLWPSTVAAAHRRIRCGQALRVCYRRRCVRVLVRDRGPFVGGRELDLTEAAVRRLGARSARHWGVRWISYEEEAR